MQFQIREDTSVSSGTQSYDSSVDSDVTEDSINGKKIHKHSSRQQVVELAPIPSLRDLSVSAPITDSTVRMTIHSVCYTILSSFEAGQVFLCNIRGAF